MSIQSNRGPSNRTKTIVVVWLTH